MRVVLYVIMLFFITTVFSVVCVSESFNPLQLASSSSTQYVISLATDASAPEKNAASELSDYLKQITGAEFRIVGIQQSTGKRVIAVGPGAAKAIMPALSLEKSKLGDDGIVIKTVDSNLILTGAVGSKRGTLYAVYSFLEDACGVRWWTQNSGYIPHKPTLKIKAKDLTYSPSIRYREALYFALDSLNASSPDESSAVRKEQFLVRSKFNGHFNKISPDWGNHYNIIGFCHTFESLMPASKYLAQHPDWYSEINGKREPFQLCCTNDDMIAQLTKNVLAAIAENPDSGIISVSQNDGDGGNCQCAKCSVLDKAEGSPSGSLLYCVNKVAEAVERQYPDFLVETLAYAYSRKPPKTIHPRRNVLIRLAIIERTAFQQIDSKTNAKILSDLKAWKAVAPNLFIWDYTPNLHNPYTPHPNLPVFTPDIRTYVDNNAIGVFFEGNHYCRGARGDFEELKIYLMSHMLWNPKQNEKRIIVDFLNGYYGKAGPILKRYIDLFDARSKDVLLGSTGCNFRGGDADASWLDLKTMNQGSKLFDQAEKAVANNSEQLDRVKRARIQLDRQWLRHYAKYKEEAQSKHMPFLGPNDITSATDVLISNIEKLEPKDIYPERVEGLQEYAIKLRQQAKNAASPALLPSELANVPRKNIVDVQEPDFTLVPGAKFVYDPKASDGGAARMDPAVYCWSVQFLGLGGLVTPGKWHVYASVRCENIKDKGVAFSAGIYDELAGKPLKELIANIEDTPRNEYHLYDLGTHNLNYQHYVWFGTTGGVDPANVKAIYVDRVVFVRENL